MPAHIKGRGGKKRKDIKRQKGFNHSLVFQRFGELPESRQVAARLQKEVKAALTPAGPQCCVAPQQQRVSERPPPVVAQQGVGAPLHRQSRCRVQVCHVRRAGRSRWCLADEVLAL